MLILSALTVAFDPAFGKLREQRCVSAAMLQKSRVITCQIAAVLRRW